MAVVTLPWFLLVQVRVPEFFRFFILEQHLWRFLTPAIHPEPFYYYLPVILGLMLPWSFLLPWALAAGKDSLRGERGFLLLWAGVILGFFSLSKGKLAPYILPALLPLALALGNALWELMNRDPQARLSRGLLAGLGLWSLAGLVVLGLYIWPPWPLVRSLHRVDLLQSPLIPTMALIVALTPVLAWLTRRWPALVLGALLLGLMIQPIIEKVSVRRSPRDLGLVLKEHWQPGAALVGVGLYSQGLSFYSGQLFFLLEARTELDFGRRLLPDHILNLSGREEIKALAASRPQVYLFLKYHDLPALERELPGKLEILGAYKDCFLASYKGK